MSKNRNSLPRRSFLAAAAGATGLMLHEARAADEPAAPPVKCYHNADFYAPGGKFLADKAREAYFDMFRRFHYPISKTLLKEMWVLDFQLGDFAHVGMAGMIWCNRQDYSYFGHEIFLLPGQMIPEHAHFATAKGPAKMESWHPRHGMIYTFGEGQPTPQYLDKIPLSQRGLVKSQCCKPLEVDQLGRPQPPHRLALHGGRSGVALVTEYGTFHDMDGLRFSNPNAKL